MLDIRGARDSSCRFSILSIKLYPDENNGKYIVENLRVMYISIDTFEDVTATNNTTVPVIHN